MALEGDLFLYRGTTRGWPGNPCLRLEEITCTTTDPLVATLFAVGCRDYGDAIVLAARREAFSDVGRPGVNYADDLECAENLCIPPAEFARRSEAIIEVGRALEILRAIGFDWLPIRIAGRYGLGQAIWDSHREGQRLNLGQIRRFNELMLEG